MCCMATVANIVFGKTGIIQARSNAHSFMYLFIASEGEVVFLYLHREKGKRFRVQSYGLGTASLGAVDFEQVEQQVCS